MRKRLLAIIVAILCVIGVTGISPISVLAADGSTEAVEMQVTGSVDGQDAKSSTITNTIDSWNSYEWAVVTENISETDGVTAEDLQRYQSWGELQTTLGEYAQVLSIDFCENTEDDSIEGKAIAKYSNANAVFTFTFDGDTVIDIDVALDNEETGSLGERMKTAGINTVMSICIVFVVLIFIACIISLFAFIPKIEAAFAGKKKTDVVETVTPVVENATEMEDVTDDLEIVAVITAAIMASMGAEAPADGLNITSIKRRTGSKWKRSI